MGILKQGNKPAFEYEFPTPTHAEEPYNSNLKKWVTFAEATYNLNEKKQTYKNYSSQRLHFMKKIPKGGGNWRNLIPLGDDIVKEAMGGAYFSGGGKVGFYRRLFANKPSPTLLTSPLHKSTNLGHPFEDRPLSIEEYLVIQQFPEDYQLAGNLNQQYKQIGNAVPTGMAFAVANSIKIRM